MRKNVLLRTILVLSATFFMLSCASSKTTGNSAAIDNGEKGADFDKIAQWADNKSFTIISDWANPLTGSQVNFYGSRYDLSGLYPAGSGGSRVSLIGNSNSLTVSKDSINGFLPYYGEVQVVRNYGGRGGITFDAVHQNYKVEKDLNGGIINISFDVEDESERFQVAIKLYSNYNAHITLNSAYRNTISYDGEVMAVKKDDDLAKK
jgi:hypothetical protein